LSKRTRETHDKSTRKAFLVEEGKKTNVFGKRPASGRERGRRKFMAEGEGMRCNESNIKPLTNQVFFPHNRRQREEPQFRSGGRKRKRKD